MTLLSENPDTFKNIVPQISGDLFSENPESRFTINVLSGKEVVADTPSPLVQAYLKLRADVYIDQIRVLEEERRRQDGTEIDDDDERSTHFVLLENKLGEVAVFGCMRLIEKSRQHNAPLPIEEFYPESFPKPARNGAIEVSRFIVRHPEQRQRSRAKFNLIRAGLVHSLANNLGPIFATIEPEFERDLRVSGVPTVRVTEPKFIEEYNTTNFGISVDKIALKQAMDAQNLTPDSLNTPGELFWGTVETPQEIVRS